MTKFTRGPIKKQLQPDGYMLWCNDANDSSRKIIIAYGVREADANLIAAASDLMNAAKAISSYIGGWKQLISELDDHIGPGPLAEAMWAGLDQIDRCHPMLHAAISKGET